MIARVGYGANELVIVA